MARIISHIIFFLILIATIVNGVMIYYYELGQGFDSFFDATIETQIKVVLTIVTLIFVGFLTLVGAASKLVRVKKNTLKFSLVLMLILVIVSFVQRFMEVFSHDHVMWRWSQTGLYCLVFVMLFILSRLLFNQLVRIVDDS